VSTTPTALGNPATLHEEKDRTILFFANDHILAELERMRALDPDR
jgi:hypothetical protein